MAKFKLDEVTVKRVENGYTIAASYERAKRKAGHDHWHTKTYFAEEVGGVLDQLEDLLKGAEANG